MTQSQTAISFVPWPIRAAVGVPLGMAAIATAGLAKLLDGATKTLVGDLL